MRYYVYLFFTVLFIVNAASLIVIPTAVWGLMEWWQIILYILPVLSSLCMVLLSYWSWKDQEEIEQLYHEISTLRKAKD